MKEHYWYLHTGYFTCMMELMRRRPEAAPETSVEAAPDAKLARRSSFDLALSPYGSFLRTCVG